MKTEPIDKTTAYKLLEQAGIKPVLPYRGYATAINSTDRIAMTPAGELVLITADKEQGKAFVPDYQL